MTKVALHSTHIHLDSSLAKDLFADEAYAAVAYDATNNRLLIAPASNTWFAKMHKPLQFLLKTRNAKGDKAVGVREIILDNDIDPTDRPLTFEVVSRTGLLKVNLT